MEYEVIFFDAGDTLVRDIPSPEEQMLSRLAGIGDEGATHKDARRMVAAAKNAEYAQLLREWKGEPRMPDEKFFAPQDRAALGEWVP